MIDDDKAIEKIVLTQLLRLNTTIAGLISGVLIGVGIFLATIILILKGGDPVGPHLALLGQFFIGYQVTFLGSFIGLAYGFITGFIAGYVIAWLYNWFAELRQSKRS
jgi:hypothetical protein